MANNLMEMLWDGVRETHPKVTDLCAEIAVIREDPDEYDRMRAINQIVSECDLDGLHQLIECLLDGVNINVLVWTAQSAIRADKNKHLTYISTDGLLYTE